MSLSALEFVDRGGSLQIIDRVALSTWRDTIGAGERLC